MSETPSNPYSAPDAPLDTPSGGKNRGGADFNISETMRLAWDATTTHWLYGSLAMFVLMVLIVLVYIVAALAASPLNPSFTEESLYGSLVTNVLQTIMQAPISMSIIWVCYLAVFSYRKAVTTEFSVGAISKGFEMIGAAVLIVLLINFVYLVVALPGGIITGILAYAMLDGNLENLANPAGDPGSFGLIYLAIFILVGLPAIYVGLRLLFSMYICAERNLGVVDSVKASWALTEGRVLQMFLYYLLIAVLFIVASPLLAIGILLTCGLGILPLTFLTGNLTAALYYNLSRGGSEKY